jgi:hypothetical protein
MPYPEVLTKSHDPLSFGEWPDIENTVFDELETREVEINLKRA